MAEQAQPQVEHDLFGNAPVQALTQPAEQDADCDNAEKDQHHHVEREAVARLDAAIDALLEEHRHRLHRRGLEAEQQQCQAHAPAVRHQHVPQAERARPPAPGTSGHMVEVDVRLGVGWLGLQQLVSAFLHLGRHAGERQPRRGAGLCRSRPHVAGAADHHHDLLLPGVPSAVANRSGSLVSPPAASTST